jgi:L-histidine N-alpha-methyltransferase
MNRELGATFNLRNFEHVAIYDKRRGSVDSFLQAKCAHAVEIPSANITAEFADGELMHTETSFKFSEDDIARLALRSGFTVADTWYDRSHRFATHLLVREGSAVPVS